MSAWQYSKTWKCVSILIDKINRSPSNILCLYHGRDAGSFICCRQFWCLIRRAQTSSIFQKIPAFNKKKSNNFFQEPHPSSKPKNFLYKICFPNTYIKVTKIVRVLWTRGVLFRNTSDIYYAKVLAGLVVSYDGRYSGYHSSGAPIVYERHDTPTHLPAE